MKLKKTLTLAKFAGIGTVSKVLHAWKPEFARKYLVDQLSQMPGLPAKVAQVLSMKFNHGLTPKSQIAPMPLEWVREQIENDAPVLAKELDEISEEAIYASLGQVRRGKLKDGREVAIKVQYPDVDQEFLSQLDLMMDGLSKIPKSEKYGFDASGYRRFLTEFFEAEIDYKREAQEQLKFEKVWADHPYLVVPHVLDMYCSKKVLVQSYEPSLELSELKMLPEADRRAAAEWICRLFLESIFVTGTVHADFHPKNFGYRTIDRKLVLYDFGAVLMLDTNIRAALKNLAAGESKTYPDYLMQFTTLGFDTAKLARVANKLPELCWILFEPLLEQGEWEPTHWNIQKRLDELLGEDKWWFRISGPPWFFIFMRSVLGAAYALGELNVKVPISKWFHDLGYSSHWKRPESLTGVNVTTPHAAARFLKVRVTDGGDERVMIELPAVAVEDLEGLIPEESAKSIESMGVNIREVSQRAVASGFVPQTLFEATVGAKTYRIWLE